MNWLERLDEIAVKLLPEDDGRNENIDQDGDDGNDTGILIDPLLDMEYTGNNVADNELPTTMQESSKQSEFPMISQHDKSVIEEEDEGDNVDEAKQPYPFSLEPIAPETSMLDDNDLSEMSLLLPSTLATTSSEQSTGDSTTERRKGSSIEDSTLTRAETLVDAGVLSVADQAENPIRVDRTDSSSAASDPQRDTLEQSQENILSGTTLDQPHEITELKETPITQNAKTTISSKRLTPDGKRLLFPSLTGRAEKQRRDSDFSDASGFRSPKRKFSLADSDVVVPSTPGVSVDEENSERRTQTGKPLSTIDLPDIFNKGFFDVEFPLTEWMDTDAPPFEAGMNRLGVVHVRVLAAKGLPCPVGSSVQPAVSLLPWKGLVRGEATTAFDADGVCVKWDTLSEASGCSMVHSWNSDDTPVPTIKVDLMFKPVKVLEFNMCTLELSCEPLMRKPEVWKKQWCEAKFGKTIETTKRTQHPLILVEAAFIPAQDDEDKDQVRDLFNENRSIVSGSKSVGGSIATMSTFMLKTKNKPHLLKKHHFWVPASCCVCKKNLMGWGYGFRCEACGIDCCKDCRLQIDLQMPCGSSGARQAAQASLQNRITVDKVLTTIAPIDAEYEKKMLVNRRNVLLNERKRSVDYDSDSDSDTEEKEQKPATGRFEIKINRACIFEKPLPLEAEQQTVFDGSHTLPLRSADYYVRISSNASNDTIRTQTVQSSGKPKFSSPEMVMDMPHYGVEYRIDVTDTLTEKSVGTTLLTAQSIIQMQQDRRIAELRLNAFVPTPPKDGCEKPLKLKLELRSGLKKGFGSDYFVPPKPQRSNTKEIKPGSISGWISVEVCINENFKGLFGPTPIECPKRPPDKLDVEMFQVHIGRISNFFRDIGHIFDGYNYLVSWKNPLFTLLSFIVLIHGTITFDAEYIGSLPFYFLVPGMAYLGYLRMSGHTKNRFITREKESQMKLEKEATLNYSIHRPMGRVEVEVFKGKNLRSRELGLPGSVGCQILWDPLRYCRDAKLKASLSDFDKILKANHEVGNTNYVYNSNPVWESKTESSELKRLRQLLPSQGSFLTETAESCEMIQFPILQPIRAKKQRLQAAKKSQKTLEEDVELAFWSESKNAIVIQVCFRDVINRYANLEHTLGEVAIPISKLIENGEISGWFQVLEAGTTRVVRGSEEPGDETPQIYVRLHWKQPEEKVNDAEREASIVAAEELIRSATSAAARRVGWIDNSIGAFNSVRGVGGNVQSVQNTIGSIADMLETMRNLVNFTHPQKSSLILMVLVVLSLFLMIVPTRMLVLLGVTAQYATTAVAKWSKTAPKMEKPVDGGVKSGTNLQPSPVSIWMANIVKSTPTDEDLRKAFFWESRRVATQEAGKLATQKRLLRLERLWKANWYSQVQVRVANTQDSSKSMKDWHWEDAFAVVHGRRLLLWESEQDFDKGNPPLKRIFLSGHAGLASLSPLEMRDLRSEELPLVVGIFGRGGEGQEKLTILLPELETKDLLEDAIIAASLKKE